MLSRPFRDWPPVLCGPILRRVTSDLVTVFVALKAEATVALKVRVLGSSSWVATGQKFDTVAVGRRLHVCVAIAVPDSALQPGRIYEYDLEVKLQGTGATSNLASLGLLAGPHAYLGYGGANDLPSFSLPSGLADFKLVQGSCRLPHGDGWDMLALLDGNIYQHLADAARRPHQLVLTGDQIYADDVAPCLLAMLTATGRELLGWTEQELIPFREGAQFVSLDTQPATPHRACPPLGPARSRFRTLKHDYRVGNSATRTECSDFLTRAELIAGQSELTSDKEDCHLLFLAEYCAMYLFAWSDALWPRDKEDALTVPTVEEVVPPIPVPGSDTELEKSLVKFRKEAEKSRTRLLRYMETVSRVRRVLANVPTAMMFDDHEVTDDWNLNGWWYRSNLANPVSRRTIRNALLAYAVFQDWGSQPDQYQPGGKGWDLLNTIRWNNSGKPPIASEARLADLLLGLPAADAIDSPVDTSVRKRWDYVLPGPGWQFLFLDTRTWRRFDYSGLLGAKAPAELISAAGLAMQMDPSRMQADKLTFVVSGTPIFGPARIETLQEIVAHFPQKQWEAVACGPEGKDYEAWAANNRGLDHLISALVLLRRVVVLTGDVHYGFVNSAAFVQPHTGQRARIVQVCASALKNHFSEPKKAEWFFSNEGKDTDWHGAAVVADGQWTTALLQRLIKHYDQEVREARDRGAPNADIEELLRTRLQLNRAKLAGTAATLSNWPGSAHAAARDLLRSYLVPGATPRWHYRVVGVHPAHHQYSLDRMKLIVGGLRQSTDRKRYCIGHGNIGMLEFAVGAGGVESVTQTLWFDDNQEAHQWPGASPAGLGVIDAVIATASLKPPRDEEL